MRRTMEYVCTQLICFSTLFREEGVVEGGRGWKDTVLTLEVKSEVNG